MPRQGRRCGEDAGGFADGEKFGRRGRGRRGKALMIRGLGGEGGWEGGEVVPGVGGTLHGASASFEARRLTMLTHRRGSHLRMRGVGVWHDRRAADDRRATHHLPHPEVQARARGGRSSRPLDAMASLEGRTCDGQALGEDLSARHPRPSAARGRGSMVGVAGLAPIPLRLPLLDQEVAPAAPGSPSPRCARPGMTGYGSREAFREGTPHRGEVKEPAAAVLRTSDRPPT
jgi:hypothetical protein